MTSAVNAVAEVPDCTPSCRSSQCAANLISVVTRGSTRQIKTYFAHCCSNAAHVSDSFGRTALHVAASCGKWEVVDWLMRNGHADHRTKDKESGWTPLHRSLFYGQVMSAVYLIHHGASIYKHDNEDLTPLDLLMRDRPVYVEYDLRNPTQVYTWGTNTNFTLGHGNQQSRGQPELMEELAKSSISIKQVVMCKFHTVLLSHQGSVYTCGHGQGGRLGLGMEEAALVPRCVEGLGDSVCIQIAAARDHTMFLMENGTIYSCGQNDYHQLGHSSLGAKCLTPKPIYNKVIRNKSLAGVAVGRFHTVVFTDDILFTFGLNAGQLGHSKGEKYLQTPRQVTSLQHKNVVLCQVTASDAATVVATKAGDIYVLNEYQCRKVASKQLNLTKLVVNGGTLDADLDPNILQKKGGEELVMVALQKSGRIHSWRGRDRVLKTCQWTRKRQIFISDVALSRQGLLLATEDGEGYMGYFTKKSETSARRESSAQSPPPTRPLSASSPPPPGSEDAFIFAGPVEKEEYETVHLERLPSTFRATGVSCDQQGRNFAVLQSDPRTSLTDIPLVSESEMQTHFSNLLSEADTTDVIHDVIFKIGNRTIPAHKYILSHRSEYFRKLFSPHSDTEKNNTDASAHIDNEGKMTVDVTDKADYEIFMLMLRYIYTDTCDVFKRDYKYRSSHTGNVLREDNSEQDLHIGLDSLTITDLNRSRSAYSVYKEHQGSKKGGKGHGGKRKKKTAEKGEREDAMLPVRLVIEVAKKFGVSTLVKRLDQVKYRDGHLQNFRPSGKKLRFERKRSPHLTDVVLQSDDGQLFSCHKCVLVARLEYFQSMLGAGWIETSSTDPLKLPIPGKILDIILNFIYTANAPFIHECQDIELLCNTLTTADQLLMTRLKEICEGALADMITLKNAAELLQFASVYQATQLACTCQQFIGLNLASLLEARALEVLDPEVLEELTKAYRDMLPSMCYRVITPYYGGPDISYIDSEDPSDEESSLREEDHDGGEMTQIENQGSANNMEQIAKKARVKRKGRRRTSSSGKRNSVSISESIEDSHRLLWRHKKNLLVEMIQKKGRQSEASILPVAMETDELGGGEQEIEGHEKMVQEGKTTEEVAPSAGMWIRKGDKDSYMTPPNTPPTPKGSKQVAYRTTPSKAITQQLSISTTSQSVEHQTKAMSPRTWGWQSPGSSTPDPTLSDLLSEAAEEELAVQFAAAEVALPVSGSGDAVVTEERPPSCPWASVAKPIASVTSLKKLQEEEVKGQASSSKWNVPKRSQNIPVPNAQVQISYGVRSPPSRRTSEGEMLANRSGATSPESPSEYHNPWQQGHTCMVAKSPPTAPSVSFSNILNVGGRKSFSLIQVEERAIEELKQMYKVTECVDEYITVERVGVVVAIPTWKKGKR
ncbi:LOW QUALITY PROTEIN: inhibitor of Bruton tyrosine kinase-like [Amphiura filiformis]|uniref:LOW QUALITY PROTEIN: inhibitor of Bruton tyrosine kinase-like n=1 Tax=Amphiura filiformis TaxID=82378 RepID=UPI003B223B6B